MATPNRANRFLLIVVPPVKPIPGSAPNERLSACKPAGRSSPASMPTIILVATLYIEWKRPAHHLRPKPVGTRRTRHSLDVIFEPRVARARICHGAKCDSPPLCQHSRKLKFPL